jgi:cytoskeletal protein CcmA (bactofilin family)
MKKLLVFLAVAVTVLFLSAAPLWASESGEKDETSFSTGFNDDLYVFGSDIFITDDVKGDLVAAGGNIDIDADIAQDLMVAGGMIDINADIGDDVRAAGGTLNISGNIGDDLIAAGGQIYISDSSVIGGALALTGGTLQISGTVQDDASLSGGSITISGKIDGDVMIEEVERLKVTGSAEIMGDLIYKSATMADISDKAAIGGEVKETIVEEEVRLRTHKSSDAPWAIFTATYIGGRIIAFLSLFVLGIILILAMPGFFQKFNDRMKNTLGYCVGGGAIVLFGVPVASVIVFIISILLFITIIGSGLGMVAMASNVVMLILYGLLIYLSTIFLSYLLGRVILSKTSLNMEKYGWKVLAYLIGLVIIMIAYSIPFIGWLMRFTGILFGLGGLVLVLKDMIAKGCKRK